MDRRELPPILKNYVYEVIQAEGLEPVDFKWVVVRGPQVHYLVSRLDHAQTGFFVLFDYGSAGYHVTTWPGDRAAEGVTEVTLKQVVRAWARRIAPELTAPDLWKLAADQSRIGTDPLRGNAPFTPDEQKHLETGLFQLEEFVYQTEPQLPQEKREAVKARFGYLKAAVTRLGRIDWTSLLVGQLFSMVAEKIITVQTFIAAYNIAANLLTKVVSAGTNIATRLIGSG